jgi:hypothetical protein
MTTQQALRAPEVGRRLGITTKDVLRLMHAHELRTVTIDGIAHVTEDGLDEYRQRTR